MLTAHHFFCVASYLKSLVLDIVFCQQPKIRLDGCICRNRTRCQWEKKDKNDQKIKITKKLKGQKRQKGHRGQNGQQGHQGQIGQKGQQG